MALGTGAPTDPTRRMAQTMALARKVIAQQKELESLKRSLEEHQAEVLRLQRALADANKLLDNTAQPHELLVSAVRSRDEDLRSNRAEIERLKTVLASVQGERNKLRDQCAELKKNIEQVVEKRNTTETLQTAVAHLQAQEQINLMKLNQARLRRGATSAASATDYWNLTALAGAEGAGTLPLVSQIVPPGTGWLGLSGGGLAGSGSQQIAQQIAQQPQPQALWFQKLKAKAS
jgi:chromosome segregation ATPase